MKVLIYSFFVFNFSKNFTSLIKMCMCVNVRYAYANALYDSRCLLRYERILYSIKPKTKRKTSLFLFHFENRIIIIIIFLLIFYFTCFPNSFKNRKYIWLKAKFIMKEWNENRACISIISLFVEPTESKRRNKGSKKKWLAAQSKTKSQPRQEKKRTKPNEDKLKENNNNSL